jgi:putative transcriptional regulator
VIQHHPSAELLPDWARGSLHAGAMLAVGCHIYGCAICRREAALWESVGGNLLDAATSASLSEGALARALERLDTPAQSSAAPAQNHAPGYLHRFNPPAPLLAQKIGMRRWVTPNIWFAPIAIPSDSTARTYLVYARRNTVMSKHTHVGHEFTNVLYGSFSDDTGTYGPGDFAETDDSVTHAPAITGDADCLSLISTDAPMRLLGLTARAIQTMTGTLY